MIAMGSLQRQTNTLEYLRRKYEIPFPDNQAKENVRLTFLENINKKIGNTKRQERYLDAEDNKLSNTMMALFLEQDMEWFGRDGATGSTGLSQVLFEPDWYDEYLKINEYVTDVLNITSNYNKYTPYSLNDKMYKHSCWLLSSPKNPVHFEVLKSLFDKFMFDRYGNKSFIAFHGIIPIEYRSNIQTEVSPAFYGTII